jgi:hypothetical protein
MGLKGLGDLGWGGRLVRGGRERVGGIVGGRGGRKEGGQCLGELLRRERLKEDSARLSTVRRERKTKGQRYMKR